MRYGCSRIAILLTMTAIASCAPSTPTSSFSPYESQPPSPRTSPATVRALNLSPSSVIGGQTASGTIVLTAAAPAAGIVIDLSVDDPAVSVPATVRVSSGATSANFIVDTTPVRAMTIAMITGKYRGTSKIVGLAVRAPALSSIALNPTAVTGGAAATATLRLNGMAPADGIVVTLSSNTPSRVGVPPSIAIAAGTDTATFPVNTTGGDQAAATVSASYNGNTKSAALTIQRKKPQLATASPFKRAAGSGPEKMRAPQTY